ncbi:MAG: hypothetical protein E7Z63_01515 [Thermoplasmata archaeon]|nr:hypothetical protein [Thermoplasmata archaeon]
MGIGEFVYDLFGGNGEWGLLLCIFLIFLLDAFLFPTLPELFFVIAYMGGQEYGGGLAFDGALLLMAILAELVGIFSLYYVVKHVRVPRKIEKLINMYTKFLLLGDERLLLLNRIAPMIPFAGAFIAISKWNPYKSAAYIVIGCVVKYGFIMLLADFFYSFFGSSQAELFTIIMIFAVIGISVAASVIVKKRKGLDGDAQEPPSN